jgi:hypothetical protein
VTDTETQPFVPAFDDTATQPLDLPGRHRRSRRVLPAVGVLLAVGAMSAMWAWATASPAVPPAVVDSTVLATAAVKPVDVGTVNFPEDGATMPSSPRYAVVVAPSVHRTTTPAVRPSMSPSAPPTPSQSPSPSPSGSVPAPSGSSPSVSPSGSASPSSGESSP